MFHTLSVLSCDADIRAAGNVDDIQIVGQLRIRIDRLLFQLHIFFLVLVERVIFVGTVVSRIVAVMIYVNVWLEEERRSILRHAGRPDVGLETIAATCISCLIVLLIEISEDVVVLKIVTTAPVVLDPII